LLKRLFYEQRYGHSRFAQAACIDHQQPVRRSFMQSIVTASSLSVNTTVRRDRHT
jgi:hypothetical protein